MELKHVENELDLDQILYTEEQILARMGEVAAQIELDYEGEGLLLVGVLKGAVMVMADLARGLNRHAEMDWMAISSSGCRRTRRASSASSRTSTPTSAACTCWWSRTSSTPV